MNLQPLDPQSSALPIELSQQKTVFGPWGLRLSAIPDTLYRRNVEPCHCSVLPHFPERPGYSLYEMAGGKGTEDPPRFAVAWRVLLRMASSAGLEPATSGVTSRCSNLVNYEPEVDSSGDFYWEDRLPATTPDFSDIRYHGTPEALTVLDTYTCVVRKMVWMTGFEPATP